MIVWPAETGSVLRCGSVVKLISVYEVSWGSMIMFISVYEVSWGSMVKLISLCKVSWGLFTELLLVDLFARVCVVL